ncbi:MAG: glycoside hydrolase family 97 catalytic domain-containing protein [Leptospiraceae bacterium]|nr:glycoside hydrolase family 97 catalytic domain-containing protein [Leptospiraceae bacterium]
MVSLIGCSLFAPVFRDLPLDQMPVTKSWTLVSVDGALALDVMLSKTSFWSPKPLAGDRLYYRLRSTKPDQVLLQWSETGIEVNAHEFHTGLTLVSDRSAIFEDRYNLAHGKASSAQVQAQRLELQLANPDGLRIGIEFHLQNDGAAFRYILNQSSGLQLPLQVQREFSEFHPGRGQKAWMQEYQEASKVSPAYEYFYNSIQTGKSHEGRRTIRSLFNPVVEFTGLVIFGSDGWALPALVESAPQKFVLLTEAGLDSNYAGSHLENEGSGRYRFVFAAPKEGLGTGASQPRVNAWPLKTPWRVMIAGGLDQIVASTMVTDLAEPLDPVFKGRLPDWVQPGKVAWDWWSYLSTGDLERQKKYVDAAAEFGWPYVLVDANWNQWPDVEQRIQELVHYAASKKIGIFLWYNSGGPNNRVTEEPRDRMHQSAVRQAEFARLRQWGVKGVKIDFWHSDKQVTIQQYLDVLSDAARFQLMVNLHGCTIPRGWQRRFPNLMTHEAVKGAEWYRFPVFRGPNAKDNVYYSFTRNVIGPMDYTPVVFAAALEDQQISYAHSLALALVFESSLLHLADNADQPDQGYRQVFASYPFARDFLRALPTSWDETRLLYGHPDQAIVLARRKGSRWFIGGISASDQALTIRIDPGFAAADMQLIRDGAAPQALAEEPVRPGPGWQITIPPRGGFVMY